MKNANHLHSQSRTFLVVCAKPLASSRAQRARRSQVRDCFVGPLLAKTHNGDIENNPWTSSRAQGARRSQTRDCPPSCKYAVRRTGFVGPLLAKTHNGDIENNPWTSSRAQRARRSQVRDCFGHLVPEHFDFAQHRLCRRALAKTYIE
jgi:hypothetical protein